MMNHEQLEVATETLSGARATLDEIAAAIQSDTPGELHHLAEMLYHQAGILQRVAAHAPGHLDAMQVFPSEEAALDEIERRYGERRDVWRGDWHIRPERVASTDTWIVAATTDAVQEGYLGESGRIVKKWWPR